MKKVINILFLLVVSFSSIYAQDIIITNDAIRIDAKILEITDYEVKYKQFGDPNERVATINTSSIASIVFENGEVHTFKNNTSNPKSKNTNEDLESEILKEFEITNNEEGHMSSSYITKPDIVVFEQGKRISFDRFRNKYIYGNYILNNRELGGFLKQNCPEAYKIHKINRLFVSIGGCLVMVSSIPFLSVACSKNPSEKAMIATGILWGVGYVAAISMIVTSGILRTKPIAIFNEKCRGIEEMRTASLSFSLSPSGAGLSLNF